MGHEHAKLISHRKQLLKLAKITGICIVRRIFNRGTSPRASSKEHVEQNDSQRPDVAGSSGIAITLGNLVFFPRIVAGGFYKRFQLHHCLPHGDRKLA